LRVEVAEVQCLLRGSAVSAAFPDAQRLSSASVQGCWPPRAPAHDRPLFTIPARLALTTGAPHDQTRPGTCSGPRRRPRAAGPS